MLNKRLQGDSWPFFTIPNPIISSSRLFDKESKIKMVFKALYFNITVYSLDEINVRQ